MKKQLKPFIFTYKSEDHNGDLLILNTFNGEFLKIPNNLKDDYINILDSDFIELDENNSKIAVLYDKKFLVDIEYDEKELVLDAFNKVCCNEDVLFLTIMPTEKCNFRCIYCYEDYKKGKMTLDDQESLLKYVEEKLNSCRVLYTSWFGGEPLLALDVIENLSQKFIKLCRNRNIPYISSITTNGYLLDVETFKKLHKLRIVNYQITLDGNKNTHDSQRVLINGGTTFDRIIKNLIDIKENIRTNMFKIDLRTNLTVDVRNNSLTDYIMFLKSTFGNDKRFGMIVRKAWNGKNDEEFEEKAIYERQDMYLEEHIKLILDDEKKLYFDSDYNLSCYGGQVCYAGKVNSFVIGSDLSIYKCTVHFADPINNIGKICNGIAMIDQSKLGFWSRSKLFEEGTKCFSCKNALNCLGVGCVYATNLSNSDTFYEECEDHLNVACTNLILISKNDKFVKVLSDG